MSNGCVSLWLEPDGALMESAYSTLGKHLTSHDTYQGFSLSFLILSKIVF